MRIAEILFWNNDSTEKHRADPQFHLPPLQFGDDLTSLASAFTRDGMVKHLWDLSGSEGQPLGPAPLEAGTELIPNSTLEPTTASWQAEPVETERPVDQHPLDPLAGYRGV
jgi:hypothetical protein